MGHIPFCFYPSLLEQWLNCFNNLYMGKTFKRQIKCSLESVQIELSRGHWILNTTHINWSIQNYPHSQSTYINHPHSESTHISPHTHTITHILNTAYISPCMHTRAHTHTHIFFFLHLIAQLHQGKNHVPSAWKYYQDWYN